MNKVLLSQAIKNETVFMIDNLTKTFSEPYYNVINGRIKFQKLEKRKLLKYNLEGKYQRELLENLLVCLKLEYINLNKKENSIDIFENNCKLVDLDGYHFKVFSTKGYGLLGTEEMEEIYKIFELPKDSYYGNTFEPKIRSMIELFFIVPEEETDYYFEIENGKIIEI